MELYSTKNKNNIVDLKKAVMSSLPEDGGLYMPRHIPIFTANFFSNIVDLSLSEIGYVVSRALIVDYIPDNIIQDICNDAINFPAPLVPVNDNIYTLELFHGPSLAFKDFGARYMSRLMSYFNRNEDKKLTILVATSGDTGGAVASGFYDTDGIEVIILYPSGGVSELQEKQLTTLGKNIKSCEVSGSFDDCQAIVKKAFLDKDILERKRLSSANSINIARLIPQSFYYFEIFKLLNEKEIVISVPSGNFGNLTAGLLAKRMGLPIHHFIAATNINKIVPHYLETGIFDPKPSIATISNAMDVGNPSNFQRMMDLYNNDLNEITKDLSGHFYTDEETKTAMRYLHTKHNYIADPHGAIGFKALNHHLNSEKSNQVGVFLETAHPGKFLPTVEETLGFNIDLPDNLSDLYSKERDSFPISNSYEEFKEYIINN